MKYLAFFIIPFLFASCSGDENNNLQQKTDTVKVSQNQKDSLTLTEKFIEGNWKLVWIAGDSIKITPKMRANLMKVKVFFKFNQDKSYFYIQNNTTVKGTWKVDSGQLCIHLKSAKQDQCTTIKIITEDKISFMYKYAKDHEAEITLTRVKK